MLAAPRGLTVHATFTGATKLGLTFPCDLSTICSVPFAVLPLHFPVFPPFPWDPTICDELVDEPIDYQFHRLRFL